MLVSADGAPVLGARSLPSISAEHVRLHRPSNVELLRARIELSPEGLRSTRLRDGTALEILQDFAGGRAWLADRDRGIVHELALVTDTDADIGADAGELAPGTTGFLGTDVCGGGTSRDEGGGRWRGRAVRAFACEDERRRVRAIELIDDARGIVVFRRTPDGLVDELRDIRARRYPKGHFSPPSRFRRVSARELVHGTPELSMFREPETDIASGESGSSPAGR